MMTPEQRNLTTERAKTFAADTKSVAHGKVTFYNRYGTAPAADVPTTSIHVPLTEKRYIRMKAATYILCTAVLSGGALAAGAQAPERRDTADISEVVVTGVRAATDARHLSQTVSVVSREEIERSQQSSLLPVITEQVPGLFATARGVMGYGVSDGAAGALSLRGLSGSSARLMVLVDGHPQYAGIFGHPIADAAQTFLTERVEVLQGPASVIYGSGAMGGVVNIVTRQMTTDGVRTHLRGGYGSWNTLETELTNRVRKGRFSSVAGASYNRTDGHRPRMPFEQMSGYVKLGYDLATHWRAQADANVTHFNASYPGPVEAPLFEGDQRITRGTAQLALQNNYRHTSGGLSFFYNWGHHHINDGYTPSAGEQPQDDRFISRDDMMGLSLYQSVEMPAAGGRLTLGADWFRYGGQAWTKYLRGEQAGTRSRLVSKHDHELAGYADYRQDAGEWLTANVGLRVDHHSRCGTEWVPQVGLAFHLPRNMELKASASKGFRYATLREMYMFPPQNPDLKPESMWNYEVAFSHHVMDGRLRYGANVFYIDAKNLILTLPNPSGSGRLNQNSGRLHNAGLELQAAWRVTTDWSVDANYSYLHMKRPVVAAPEHKLYVGAVFNRGPWQVSSGVQYVGGLYTATDPTPQTEDFVLWNVRGSWRATSWLTLWARGENLLAQRYEINAGYPMPRATAMAGVNLTF